MIDVCALAAFLFKGLYSQFREFLSPPPPRSFKVSAALIHRGTRPVASVVGIGGGGRNAGFQYAPPYPRPPKLRGPDATGWHHRASWRQRCNSVPTARR